MNTSIDLLIEYLPFVIPIVLLEFGLMLTALVHVLRHKKYRIGNRLLWVIIVVCLQIIGPIIYLTIGRSEE